jgi:hypothetical protein
MKHSKPPKQPNYAQKLQYRWRIGALPRAVGLHMVTIWHDDWCGIYQGKACNCDPDITLKATLPGA